MPRVDELTIHRGLPADRLQARAIKERWQQWMPVERLIQSGDRPRGALEGAGERGVNAKPGTDGVVRLLRKHGSVPSGFQVHRSVGRSLRVRTRHINALNVRLR